METNQEYLITKDESGHTYVIPSQLKEKWDYMTAYDEEGILMDRHFSQYMIGGDWKDEYKLVKR